MKYAAYSKMARTFKSGPLIPLDRYCRDKGISYFVSTSRPTLFEFDPLASHVFINYPDKSVTVPTTEKDDPEHILSLLAYVGQRYDALETIAHLHHTAALNNASRQNPVAESEAVEVEV